MAVTSDSLIPSSYKKYTVKSILYIRRMYCKSNNNHIFLYLLVANQTAHSMLKLFVPFYSLIVYRSYLALQSASVKIQRVMVSKPKLFLTISVLTIAVLVPSAVLPYINHPFFVYRISLHVTSIIISVFLIVVSILTYRRTGSIKILYTSIAFLSLLVVESIFLLQIIDSSSRIIIPMVYTELPHILLLVMLALFGLGVLRVEK
jgi:hypothetical protein